MLERKDIKNGNLVYDSDHESYYIIDDVGNAREKGDRGISTTPDDELSYSIVNIFTGEKQDGICEHSAMTSTFLSIVSRRDVEIYLEKLEADTALKIAVLKKEFVKINEAIHRFSKTS